MGPHLKSEAGYTKPHPSAPFLPYLFRQDGKDRAVGDIGKLQICDSQSLRRVVYTIIGTPAPFTQGSLGFAPPEVRRNGEPLELDADGGPGVGFEVEAVAAAGAGLPFVAVFLFLRKPVSYTHLDVYKRQS